jgi:hypothetical protein
MLRSAKITYSDGTVINTSLAAHLTDKEIYDYFKVGSKINIGNGPLDNLQTVVSCEITPLKGLIVDVYYSVDRDGTPQDCTNNGLSSNHRTIMLCGEGLPEIFTSSDDIPAFRVVKNVYRWGEHIHVEPWEKPHGYGWMFGGNYCKTSDSRFPHFYPLAIHDRQEF